MVGGYWIVVSGSRLRVGHLCIMVCFANMSMESVIVWVSVCGWMCEFVTVCVFVFVRERVYSSVYFWTIIFWLCVCVCVRRTVRRIHTHTHTQCACVCICVYACVCVCVCICDDIYVSIYVRVGKYVCMHGYVGVCDGTWICVCMSECICGLVCVLMSEWVR